MNIPNKKGVEIAIKKLFRHLFPFDDRLTLLEIEQPGKTVTDHLDLMFTGLTPESDSYTQLFINTLPSIKKTLLNDAGFIFESDPAAKDIIEVVAIYPGFFAIYCHRIAHALHLLSVPLLPRMITEYAHKVTGIDIHPGATIGSPFSIDHGTGIVIGETAVIGNNVKLFQGVTLGALSVDKSKASTKRHPTIEDNVILYAGSTILGGSTVVGKNSIIGGNVWLTESVAPFSIVYHKSQIVIRDQNLPPDVINFSI
ncbi:MAG: serine acetyltransferase [Bacteroidales bacterium]|nr:serine acetyltransferase [Bacteroidales bacterium]